MKSLKEFFEAMGYLGDDILKINLWKYRKYNIIKMFTVEEIINFDCIEKYNGECDIRFFVKPVNRIKKDLIVLDYDYSVLPVITEKNVSIVFSGNNYHLYFKYEQNLKNYNKIYTDLMEKYNSDIRYSAYSLLKKRLPDTVNLKSKKMCCVL